MSSGFFDTANPHLLTSMIKTAERRPIVAARDIFDSHGRKLLACDKPISESVRDRLLNRPLRTPLEMCLGVADGVSGPCWADQARYLVEQSEALSRLGQGGVSQRVFAAMHSLQLQTVTRLLVTAGAEDGSEAFDHGVMVSFVCGVLAHRAGLSQFDLEHAVLSGLLHDVGEMYLGPELRFARRVLTFEEWQDSAMHPWISRLVLSELDTYPPAVITAIHEHHERLDGSGYPEKKDKTSVSVLGGIVIVAEALVGVLNHVHGPQSRALLALKLVPGQFPPSLVGLITQLLQPDAYGMSVGCDWEQLKRDARFLATGLSEAAHLSGRIVDQDSAAAAERGQATRIGAACRRLLVAFHATGASQLCNIDPEASSIDELTALELEVSVREMRWQVQALARDVVGTVKKHQLQSKALLTVASTLQLAGGSVHS